MPLGCLCLSCSRPGGPGGADEEGEDDGPTKARCSSRGRKAKRRRGPSQGLCVTVQFGRAGVQAES
jgi:hypothetical protein